MLYQFPQTHHSFKNPVAGKNILLDATIQFQNTAVFKMKQNERPRSVTSSE